MKKGRLSRVGGLILAIMLISILLTIGCQAQPTAATKTLKIGVVAFLGWPLGLDMVHGLQVMQDLENKNGGVSIGKDKYNIQFIVYDSNADQTTAIAAENKLIFEDQVKFIISDDMITDPLIPAAEANKVLLFVPTMTPAGLSPNNHYTFEAYFINSQGPVLVGWFIKNFPDKMTFVVACPDNALGHMIGPHEVATIQAFGRQAETEFYPANATDLSAVGTKVKTLNPDVFMAEGGGPISDAMAIKASWQAGYRGQFFCSSTSPAGTLSQLIPIEALEGMMAGAWYVEFDPPLSQQAKDFKAAWIAKYGKWEGPEIQGIAQWACLMTALQKAGSLDTDKVAAVINNGLKFESPLGLGEMIARPDLGNNRTIDSIVGYATKKISGGKPVLLHTITLDEAAGYWQQFIKGSSK